MQRLDHWHTGITAGRVHGWRDQKESVVYVNQFRPFPVNQAHHFVARVTCPNRPFCKTQAAHGGIIVDLRIATLVNDYLMAMAPEELNFLFKHHLFATILLIRVVNEDYFHRCVARNLDIGE